jgi:hypothetical protein
MKRRFELGLDENTLIMSGFLREKPKIVVYF